MLHHLNTHELVKSALPLRFQQTLSEVCVMDGDSMGKTSIGNSFPCECRLMNGKRDRVDCAVGDALSRKNREGSPSCACIPPPMNIHAVRRDEEEFTYFQDAIAWLYPHLL